MDSLQLRSIIKIIDISQPLFLSLFPSLILSFHVINYLFLEVIRRLSIYERDYTSIKHQTSLAIKSVVAQLINSIVVPIIANYYIK